MPVAIGDGVYWVGYYDAAAALHCNPYLICDGGEAVLIDGGNRPDFSTVMTRVLQAGIAPENITHLIYQHYDPDLCSSIPHLEYLINSPGLRILSHRENNIFIKYYGGTAPRLCVEEQKLSFRFSSGRELRFLLTPYAHSAGSFVTYDVRTGILFSSDLFGAYDRNWTLFTDLPDRCCACTHDIAACHHDGGVCPLWGVRRFHEQVMTSTKALRRALREIKTLPLRMIAPQHGSILRRPEDIAKFFTLLEGLERVGIDRYEGEA